MNDVFAAPLADDLAQDDSNLAPRGLRLAGALIDFLLTWTFFLGPGIVATMLVGGHDAVDRNEDLQVIVGLTALAGLLCVQATNWFFITTRGQSLAKMALGMRIVQLDGSPCGFVRGVLLRNWVLGFVSGIFNYCCMGWLVQLVDALPIFMDDRRCLHDHLAGTKVVLGGPES